jgi:hypothetical protein
VGVFVGCFDGYRMVVFVVGLRRHIQPLRLCSLYGMKAAFVVEYFPLYL